MADYQEYRRRILRKRWRRNFAVAGLLVLLILLSAVGLLWKRLHREQSPAAVQGPTIFQQELQSSEWNTISYTPARRLTVQTTSAGSTAISSFVFLFLYKMALALTISVTAIPAPCSWHKSLKGRSVTPAMGASMILLLSSLSPSLSFILISPALFPVYILP